MRPDEMGRRGAALAERVRREVDTSVRLDLMLRRHRRGRRLVVAVAAVAVIVLVVGSVWLTGRADTEVTGPPTTVTTTTGNLQSLPVEAYMILLSDYTVDPASGACEGAGVLAGVTEGSAVEVTDPSKPPPSTFITLPAGEEVATDDARSTFLLPEGVTTACVFTLPDLGYSIEDYGEGDIGLWPESDPDVASGATIRGQRVVFRFGEIPEASGVESLPAFVSGETDVRPARAPGMRTSPAVDGSTG